MEQKNAGMTFRSFPEGQGVTGEGLPAQHLL